MHADTQFAVVEATLKGYTKWVSLHGNMPQQDVCVYYQIPVA
jgi:exportin-5